MVIAGHALRIGVLSRALLERLVHEVAERGDNAGAQRVGLAAQVAYQHRHIGRHQLRAPAGTWHRQ